MQSSFQRFFKKDSTLMWMIVVASVLWITNSIFNLAAKDFRAFFINILYVICLITLGGASFRQEKNVMQGMIGALLMISVVGNLNVLSEMLEEPIPSRALWQMLVGFAVTVAIFINHFIISHSKYHILQQIKISQLLILFLLVFRCFQILLNIVSGGITTLVIEVTVGMLAIIPTLDVLICVECRGDGYKIIDQEKSTSPLP